MFFTSSKNAKKTGSIKPNKQVSPATRAQRVAQLPFALTRLSIEYILKFYYGERRRRVHGFTVRELQDLKTHYKNTSVVLIGGLGGFRFGPHWEQAVHQIVGGEVWTLGKGIKEGIFKAANGTWRCGSAEYRIMKWQKEVAIVMRRLLTLFEHSTQMRLSRQVILVGHSSGGLYHYALGVLKKKSVDEFLKMFRKEFDGIGSFKKSELLALKTHLQKCRLVAVNAPFRGICQRLSHIGVRFIPPEVLQALGEPYLHELMKRTGIKPIDVIELATHSVMTEKNSYHKKHVISNALASWLRALSRIQQRGANDGFIPKVSAYLREDSPHPLRDLDLGARDHRDVIEQEDVAFDVFLRLHELKSSRSSVRNGIRAATIMAKKLKLAG